MKTKEAYHRLRLIADIEDDIENVENNLDGVNLELDECLIAQLTVVKKDGTKVGVNPKARRIILKYLDDNWGNIAGMIITSLKDEREDLLTPELKKFLDSPY